MTDKLGIHKALAVILEYVDIQKSAWIVGGSAGLMLRGLPLASEPRDVDIYCDNEDVEAIYQSLKRYATDKPIVSVTDLYQSTLCHFLIDQVQVELVGGFRVTAMGCEYKTAVRRLLIPHSNQAKLLGGEHSVHVVPLAHELWFNALRERTDRVELIAQAYSGAPAVHEAALQAIEADNSFSDHAKTHIHRLIAEKGVGDLQWTLK